jgi:hypothetical protein
MEIYTKPKSFSHRSGVLTRSWQLAASTETEEFPLLEADIKQQVVEIKQSEKC